MNFSNGNTARRIVGDPRHTSSRVSTREFSDWIAEQARKHSEKELANIIGTSIKAAQNIRAGKSGCIGSTLATWCMNDPDFASAFAEYIGLIRPGEAEFAGALTRAFNAYQRRQATEGAE
ncbi:MAG: hypothetical protein J0H10_15920 [Alphaproteobacteria bacterium]|nr:hypothetical protein [Alphaproteobacteria bacterium]